MIKTNQILSIGLSKKIEHNFEQISSHHYTKVIRHMDIQSGNRRRPRVSVAFHAKKMKKPLRTRLNEIKHLLHQKNLPNQKPS